MLVSMRLNCFRASWLRSKKSAPNVASRNCGDSLVQVGRSCSRVRASTKPTIAANRIKKQPSPMLLRESPAAANRVMENRVMANRVMENRTTPARKRGVPRVVPPKEHPRRRVMRIPREKNVKGKTESCRAYSERGLSCWSHQFPLGLCHDFTILVDAISPYHRHLDRSAKRPSHIRRKAMPVQ